MTKPAYSVIVDSIIEQARSKRIKPGDSVGSENELAEKFGVSRMTVRKALDVLATRGVVRRQAGKGTFLARAVTGGRSPTRQTGVLICGMPYTVLQGVTENEFFAPVYEGAQRAATEAGYSLLFAPADLAHLEKPIVARACDGLILGMCAVPARRLKTFAESGFPIVLMEYDLGPEMPSVKTDRFGGGVVVAEHLLSLGHKRIALITATERPDGLPTTGGFLAALERAGIELPASLRANGDFSYESGVKATKKLLRSRKPFTAIMCANDAMARGALDTLATEGIDVPKKVSVTGFEDLRSAALATPPLTTVLVDKEELGRRAVGRLVGMIQGSPSGSDKETIPVELVVRESTAPPPGAR